MSGLCLTIWSTANYQVHQWRCILHSRCTSSRIVIHEWEWWMEGWRAWSPEQHQGRWRNNLRTLKANALSCWVTDNPLELRKPRAWSWTICTSWAGKVWLEWYQTTSCICSWCIQLWHSDIRSFQWRFHGRRSSRADKKYSTKYALDL